jgi:hypothetical protein
MFNAVYIELAMIDNKFVTRVDKRLPEMAGNNTSWRDTSRPITLVTS